MREFTRRFVAELKAGGPEAWSTLLWLAAVLIGLTCLAVVIAGLSAWFEQVGNG